MHTISLTYGDWLASKTFACESSLTCSFAHASVAATRILKQNVVLLNGRS